MLNEPEEVIIRSIAFSKCQIYIFQFNIIGENQMFQRKLLIAAMTALIGLGTLQGCAVTRGQSSVAEYVDDTAITTAIKAKFVEAKSVDATSIHIETLNGEVLLSGFAKNTSEKNDAESIARTVKGVRSVKNSISIR